MKIGLLGPGAIGSAVTAALIASGHEVAVCGRRRFRQLVVESEVGHGTYPISYNDDPDRVEPVDVLFVAVKGHQLETAAAWFPALVHSQTIVVACLNGVEHETQLRPLVGEAPVVPVVVMLPAHAREPGRLFIRMAGTLLVPDSDAGRTVTGLFGSDFLAVETVEDFAARSWRKLMRNAVSGGIATLTRQPLDISDDEDARELVVGMLQEILEVARAEGVDLDIGLVDEMADGLAGAGIGHRSSIVVDRLAGRPTEWRSRNEVVVRLAAQHGIPVPINQMVTTLLRLGEPN